MPLLKLYIRDLIVEGKHGVHQHEKETAQRFGVTVELDITGSRAATSDKLEDTLDWSRLRDDIVAIVEGRSYDLVERLAQEIADTMLADERVATVVVSIDKLDAFQSGLPGVRLTVER